MTLNLDIRLYETETQYRIAEVNIKNCLSEIEAGDATPAELAYYAALREQYIELKQTLSQLVDTQKRGAAERDG